MYHSDLSPEYIERCKQEGKKIGEGILFDRVVRITGYLVGTLDRFNNAKLAEVNDRVPSDENDILMSDIVQDPEYQDWRQRLDEDAIEHQIQEDYIKERAK